MDINLVSPFSKLSIQPKSESADGIVGNKRKDINFSERENFTTKKFCAKKKPTQSSSLSLLIQQTHLHDPKKNIMTLVENLVSLDTTSKKYHLSIIFDYFIYYHLIEDEEFVLDFINKILENKQAIQILMDLSDKLNSCGEDFIVKIIDRFLEASEFSDDDIRCFVENFDKLNLPCEKMRCDFAEKLICSVSDAQMKIFLEHFKKFNLHDLDLLIQMGLNLRAHSCTQMFAIDVMKEIGEVVEENSSSFSAETKTQYKNDFFSKLMSYQDNNFLSCILYFCKSFQIDDKKFLLSQAKDISESKFEWIDHGVDFVLDHLDFFNIEDKNFLIDLALNSERGYNILKVYKLIRSFDLETQNTLLEKYLIHSQASDIVKALNVINLDDARTRLLIVDKLVEKDEGVLYFLQEFDKFKIEDHDELLCVVKKIMNVPGQANRLIHHLKKFHIQENEDLKKQIVLKSIRNHYLGPLCIYLKRKYFELMDREIFPGGLSFLIFNDKYLHLFKSGSSIPTCALKDLSQWLNELKGTVSPSIRKKIEGLKSPESDEIRTQLTHFVYYYLSFFGLNEIPHERIDDYYNHGFMEAIFDLRDSEIRLDLVDHLVKIFRDAPDDVYKSFIEDIKKDNHPKKLTTKIMLTSISLDGVELIKDFTDKLLRFLKDGRNRVLLLTILKKISLSPDLEPESIVGILNYFKNLNHRSLRSELRCFIGLEAIGCLGMLSETPITTKNTTWIRDLLLERFNGELSDLDLSEDEREEFVNVFINSRMPEALSVYISKLQKTSRYQQRHLMESIKEYIKSVADGSFYDLRYENSDHLDKIFSSQEGFKLTWKTEFKIPLSEILTQTVEAKNIDFNEELKVKFNEGHLPRAQLPKLTSLLSGESMMEFDGYQYEHVDDLLCQLCSEEFSQIELRGKLTTIRKKLKQIDPDSEFLNDLTGYQQALKPVKSKSEGLMVVDTDDPIDLLLCGTEVGGSCQRISGSPSLNKALMGYVMDGKHRLLAIKDKDGTIIGRVILRLLWDEANEKPVLFFEKIYPSTLPEAYAEALLTVAKRRAADLGIDLISKESQSEILYHGTPVSLGLRENVVCEYCDGGSGTEYGGYKITNSYLISDHHEGVI